SRVPARDERSRLLPRARQAARTRRRTAQAARDVRSADADELPARDSAAGRGARARPALSKFGIATLSTGWTSPTVEERPARAFESGTAYGALSWGAPCSSRSASICAR